MRAGTLGIFLLLVPVFFGTASATKICHQCSGINCQRTSYNKTEQCVNDMDVCATVFDGLSIQAQGCLQQLAEELRRKCIDPNGKMMEPKASNRCHLCLSSLCNNVGPKDYECVQCDSEKNEHCQSHPAAVMPTQCPISRGNNAYCYVSVNGNHTIRGCAGMIQEQRDCLSQSNCFLCSPMDLPGCNAAQISNDGGNDNGNGGNGGNDNGGNGNGGNDNGGNGNGGNDNGGNGNGGNNGQSSTVVFNVLTLVLCLIGLALGFHHL